MKNTILIHKKAIICSFLAVLLAALTTRISAQEVIYSEPKSVTNLNSGAEESLPLYDESNGVIYFVRTLHQDNTGGKKSGNEIWSFSRNEQQKWVRSEDDFSSINNKYSNAVVGVSEDGNKIYLLNQYLKGGDMKAGLSYSTLKNEKWSAPKNLKLDWLDKELRIYNIYVNKNIMLLSMRSDTPDSTHSIYISEKNLDSWGKPSLLGDPISMITSDEISPFLSEDGRYLYFASNRKGGEGDFDIYRAEKKSGNLSWSKPINLKKLNSSSFDAYYSDGADGRAYFVSNRSSKLSDIYTADVEAKMDTLKMKEAIVERKVLEEKVVSLHPNVNFAFDEYKLNASAKEYLDRVADSLTNNKKWKVTLDGHTDNIGSNQYNRNLAKFRALAVRNYLIMKGVSAGRIKTNYYGERKPTATNTTDYGRFQNRRVEITFTKK